MPQDIAMARAVRTGVRMKRKKKTVCGDKKERASGKAPVSRVSI